MSETASRDRALLGAAAFVRALGVGMVGVLLGTYLPILGLDAAQAGTAVTVGMAGTLASAIAALVLADRVGRKQFLICQTLVMTLGGALAAFTSGGSLLLLCFFFGALNGMGRDRGAGMILEQAALPATVPPERRTRAFAWYNVLQDAGHALGALLAGLPSLLTRLGGMTPATGNRATLLLYPALLATSACFYLRLSERIESPLRKNARKPSKQDRRALLRISALFAIDSVAGGFLTTAMLSYLFFERFGASAGELGLLFFAARALNVLSHIAASRLAERFGLVNTMVFTHIPSSLLLVTVAFAPSFPVAVVLFLLREGLVEMDVPTRQSYVLAIVPPEERTFASSVTNLVRLAGWTIAPALAGLFAKGAWIFTPLLIGAGMKITYDLLLFFSFRRLPAPEERHV